MNENDLVKKAKNGDVEAFERLVEGYQKKVFNIAYRMLGNYDDASELAQEALIKIYKSLKSFKEESQLSTWIYRITTNVCLDELRKRKNKAVVYIDEKIRSEDDEITRQVEDKQPTPEQRAEQNEVKKAINNAIQSLSQDYKIVIILRDIQGLSYDEIAEILKCPTGTVKSRINRARQSLKELLLRKKELFDTDFVK
jgi:RNA polymerase sigma-70 factor (ECF subfamily)